MKKKSNPGLENSEVMTYAGLLRAVRNAVAGGRARAEKAVEQERVRTAWEIGKLIDEHVLQYKERAHYAEQVIAKLAADMTMSRTELYYMLEFARAYPIVRHAGQLPWSAYEILLAVNDPVQRNALAERAEKEKWSRARLREEVRKITHGDDGGDDDVDVVVPVEVLVATPGKIGTYRIIRAKAGPYAGELAVDLGFSNYLSQEYFSRNDGKESKSEILRLTSGRPQDDKVKIVRFSEGDIVTCDGRVVRKLPDATKECLFTYEAYVDEVIDGDTINAVIDLGFGFATAQTLRLRGIDAPVLASSDGMEAKTALEKLIGGGAIHELPLHSAKRTAGKAVPGAGTPIIIKTTKSDKYDRYLADIFAAGKYANQELVDQGLAVIVGS